jgi:hypothetical protein
MQQGTTSCKTKKHAARRNIWLLDVVSCKALLLPAVDSYLAGVSPELPQRMRSLRVAEKCWSFFSMVA